MDWEKILQNITGKLTEHGLSIIGAIIIFFVGKWLAKVIANIVEKAMKKTKVDLIITKFVRSLTYIVLLIFVVIAALGQAGVETTQFAVVVGAVGLAIGMAWSGSLANFASEILLVIFRPIKVGDVVEVVGVLGVVEHVQIFNTILNTPDNVKVVIPNAKVTGDCIKNLSINGTRRVDMVVGVSYEDDLKKTKQVITDVLAADEKVLKDPAPTVAVSELADSSVNFVVRPWCKVADYWDVYFGTTEKVKDALDANGITIPFPQRDIHLKKEI